MTYEVNSDDLNNYKRIQDYKPGKANPFSSYQPQESTENGENNSSGGNFAKIKEQNKFSY